MSDILSGINEILDDPNAVAKIGEIVNSLGLNGNGNSSPVLKITEIRVNLQILLPEICKKTPNRLPKIPFLRLRIIFLPLLTPFPDSSRG